MTRSYTIRVELHNSTDETDYDKLHKVMEAEGFSRTIKINGITYRLPTAEYNWPNIELTKQQILDAAERAAAKIDNEYSVVVTQAEGERLCTGLKEKYAQVVVRKSLAK